MNNKLLFFVVLLILSVSSLIFLGQTKKPPDLEEEPREKFRYVSGHDIGERSTHVFHSSDEKLFKKYNDCIGCEPYEDGDTDLWRQFLSKKHAQEIFEGYDENWEVIEEPKTDEAGVKRALAVLRDESRKVRTARIYWIEPGKRAYAYWVIQTPTIELAKEFEASKTFKEFRKSMPKEPPRCNTYGVNSSNYYWCQGDRRN